MITSDKELPSLRELLDDGNGNYVIDDTPHVHDQSRLPPDLLAEIEEAKRIYELSKQSA